MRLGLAAAERMALGLLAGALAACFSTNVARAQYAAPPPMVYTWNGGYVGVNAGVAGGADAISENGSLGVTTSGGGRRSDSPGALPAATTGKAAAGCSGSRRM
jgi:hypothetical protein